MSISTVMKNVWNNKFYYVFLLLLFTVNSLIFLACSVLYVAFANLGEIPLASLVDIGINNIQPIIITISSIAAFISLSVVIFTTRKKALNVKDIFIKVGVEMLLVIIISLCISVPFANTLVLKIGESVFSTMGESFISRFDNGFEGTEKTVIQERMERAIQEKQQNHDNHLKSIDKFLDSAINANHVVIAFFANIIIVLAALGIQVIIVKKRLII